MVTTEALEEFKKMWIWLYRHPAHDRNYYIKHVAKQEPPWRNECPLCSLPEGECRECLSLWKTGQGTLCTDPESPLSKWQNTHLGEPNFRTWYAGQMVDLAQKALAH